jgi:hypothetical protein
MRNGVPERPTSWWSHDRIIFELCETLSGPAPSLEHLFERLA